MPLSAHWKWNFLSVYCLVLQIFTAINSKYTYKAALHAAPDEDSEASGGLGMRLWHGQTNFESLVFP